MRRWDVRIPAGVNASAVVERVEACARACGLVAGERLNLKTLPGSVHWHLRRGDEAGVLEVTWDPGRGQLWLSAHENRMRGWVGEVAIELVRRLEDQGEMDG